MKDLKDRIYRPEREFISLMQEMDSLEQEVEYWRGQYQELERKYDSLLDGAVNHSHVMMGNMIRLMCNSTPKQIEESFKEKR